MKKLLAILTVLCMVISMAAVPAFAATTIKTYLVSDFTTDETGAITGGNGIELRQKDLDNGSYAYYEAGDDYFTVKANTVSTKLDPGTEIKQTFGETVTTTLEYRARLNFSEQTAEISWRPWGVKENGSSGLIKVIGFNNGKVSVGSVDTGIRYSTEKAYYDVLVRYSVASATGAQDAKIAISLFDGSEVSSYSGALPSGLNFSTLTGASIVVNRPSSGMNVLKIYNGWSFSKSAGIPQFGASIIEADFEADWSDDDFAASNNAKYINGVGLWMQGNDVSLVDEENGAYDNHSVRANVNTNSSAQFRIPANMSEPYRFEFRFKYNALGANGFSFNGVNNCNLFRVRGNNALYLNDSIGVTELQPEKWYLIRGYHNPGNKDSGADDFVSIEIRRNDDSIWHAKSATVSHSVKAIDYINFFCNVGSEIYLDDISITKASDIIGGGAASFGVASMYPAYDADIPVYHDASITFTKAVDTSAFTSDNIYICKDGTPINNVEFSWNEDNTVLSIPTYEKGHYRVAFFGVKDAEGTVLSDVYMEFDVTSPRAILTAEGKDVVATYKVKSGDIDYDAATVVVAGYVNGLLAKAPAYTTLDIEENGITTITATLIEGTDIQEVRGYVWDNLVNCHPITTTAHYR